VTMRTKMSRAMKPDSQESFSPSHFGTDEETANEEGEDSDGAGRGEDGGEVE